MLCRGVVTFLALLLVGVSAAGADELQEAASLLKSGQHQKALERVEKVLSAKPADAQARFMKGLILTEQGRTREAIEIFTKLTQDYPELPEPYNNLAVIYASQGQYERARESLEQSIRTHPSYATAYENLGDVYAKLASQAYDKALQLDSSNRGAQDKLSLVRELVGGPAPAPAPVAAASENKASLGKTSPAAPAPPSSAAPADRDTKTAAAAPAKPSPAPSPPAAAAARPEAILAAVSAWAKAWSRQDVDAYLASYAKGFEPPSGLSQDAWQRQRRERVSGPKFINVVVHSPKVTMHGPDEATVTFRQAYRSDRMRSTTTKTLTMVRDDGRWRIQQEKAGR